MLRLTYEFQDKLVENTIGHLENALGELTKLEMESEVPFESRKKIPLIKTKILEIIEGLK